MQTYRTRHLVAAQIFHYDGRNLEVGERFTATPEHATILEGLNKAVADDEVAGSPAQATSEEPSEVISSEDTENERAEKNRRRRDRQRVLHTSNSAR